MSRLVNMLPRLTASYGAGIGGVNPGDARYLGVRLALCMEAPDLPNDVFVDRTYTGSPTAASVSHVLGRGSGVKMSRVDAGAIVAGVTNEHSIRNITVRQLVGNAVRTLRSLRSVEDRKSVV